MKIGIKIQSFSDIITNSSSELFTVKTNMSEDVFLPIWERYLKGFGYDEEDSLYDTYHGNVYEEDGNLIIEFPYMCNLEDEAYDFLNAIFGEKNVTVCSY